MIRRATPSDAKALAEFGRRVFSDTFAPHNREEDMEMFLPGAYNEEQQRREIEDPATITLLAEPEGLLAGFAQIHHGEAPACVMGPEPMQISRFYVDQEWHGRGIAQSLMNASILLARTLGARTLWLGVWEHNARAIAFYEKYGFFDVGAQPFLLGTDLQTDRVLALELFPS